MGFATKEHEGTQRKQHKFLSVSSLRSIGTRILLELHDSSVLQCVWPEEVCVDEGAMGHGTESDSHRRTQMNTEREKGQDDRMPPAPDGRRFSFTRSHEGTKGTDGKGEDNAARRGARAVFAVTRFCALVRGCLARG
jgi:hypothetical protein